jgi:hypothetical protein
MTPEAGAVTFIGEVLAEDYDCGDPAVGTVPVLWTHGVRLPIPSRLFPECSGAPLEIEN